MTELNSLSLLSVKAGRRDSVMFRKVIFVFAYCFARSSPATYQVAL